MLLQAEKAPRQAIIAFDLTQYICERLLPEAPKAKAWLERLIEALLNAGVPPERRVDVAAAILTLLGASSERRDPRWARERLLRLDIDMSGDAPSSEHVSGFQSALQQSKEFPELWEQLKTIRTYPEQVRSYLRALEDGSSSGEFEDLPRAAHEEWPVLEAALTSEESFKRILFLEKGREACPRCYIVLPTGELQKLRSVGIATTKNCCCRGVIWTGG